METVKEFLSRAYKLDKQIVAAHARIAMYQDRSKKATGAVNALRLSGTPAHSILEDSVCAYSDLERETAKIIAEFYKAQKEIAGTIKRVKNADYRMLLELRYLSFMSWEQVARRMKYSERHTQAAYMTGQHYVCERCGNMARVVHHRTYIAPQNNNDPAVTLDWKNLEALCMDCHNAEHGTSPACVEGLRFDHNGQIVKRD